MNRLVATFFDILSLLIRSQYKNGVKSLIAENLVLKQQLLVMTQKTKRCPPLSAVTEYF
jgi:hypothetical protein